MNERIRENSVGVSIAVAAFILAGALTAFANEKISNVFNWKKSVASGGTIEIKGVNGDIRVEASTGTQVEVTAEKRGKRSDPDQIEIKTVENGDRVTICAVYPSPDPNLPNECKSGSEGRMNTSNNDVRVNFTVRTPNGVRFVGRTINGEVEAKSLSANAEGYAVNGNISLSGDGLMQAKTVNGSIHIIQKSRTMSRPLIFETVNGDIDVSLPSNINADVEASNVTGNISTDFPLSVKGRFINKQIHGKIGGAGSKLLFKTVNGDIRLRSLR